MLQVYKSDHDILKSSAASSVAGDNLSTDRFDFKHDLKDDERKVVGCVGHSVVAPRAHAGNTDSRLGKATFDFHGRAIYSHCSDLHGLDLSTDHGLSIN